MKSPDKNIVVARREPEVARRTGGERKGRWGHRVLLGLAALSLGAGALEVSGLRVLSAEATGTANPTNKTLPPTAEGAATGDVLRSLERRKEELEALDKEIRRREERVKAAERSLDVKISELKKIRAEILVLVEKDKGQRDARLQSIVTSVCMNMKPESAAQVLTKMDTEQVLRMLPLVPEKQLSRIFEKMEPARAAQLSADYLKMKQNIPRLPEN